MPFTSPADATRRVLPIAAVTDESGRAYPWLFDGILGKPGEERSYRSLVIDLGSVKPVTKLVAYDLATAQPVRVRTATVAGAWGEPVASLAPNLGAQEVDLGDRVARYLQLEAPEGAAAADWKLTELRAIGP
jgi:hypothetical protein